MDCRDYRDQRQICVPTPGRTGTSLRRQCGLGVEDTRASVPEGLIVENRIAMKYQGSATDKMTLRKLIPTTRTRGAASVVTNFFQYIFEQMSRDGQRLLIGSLLGTSGAFMI